MSFKRHPADHNSKVAAIAARRVLRDLDVALAELRTVDLVMARQVHRLRWVTCLTLLRSVGHVLRSIDRRRSGFLAEAVDAAWARWATDPESHLIWHSFIQPQRNLLLKEYRFPYFERATPPGEPLLLLVGDKAYGPEDAIQAGVRWWKREIGMIEEAAAGARRSARIDPLDL